MDIRHRLGLEAEIQVKNWYLQKPQVKLLEQNYRLKSGEIDLIFEEEYQESGEKELVFVEVRVRTRADFVSGLESVDWKKQRCLKRAGRLYLAQYAGRASSLRFDLLTWDGKIWRYFRNFIFDV